MGCRDNAKKSWKTTDTVTGQTRITRRISTASRSKLILKITYRVIPNATPKIYPAETHLKTPIYTYRKYEIEKTKKKQKEA